MNNRLTEKRSLLAAIALIAMLLALLLFTNLLGAQEKTQEAEEKLVRGEFMKETVSETPVQVKTWKLPDDLLKNLKDMVEEFNKRFQETIEIYKAGLKATKPEFKGMPGDVVFDLNAGVFMTREDFLRLQKDAQSKLDEQVKKDMEVKKNEEKMP